MLQELIRELKSLENIEKKEVLQRFFKTGKGEYAEGDLFLGIQVPIQRQLAKKYYSLIELNEVQELLKSKYHEFRMTGLLILLEKYKKSKKDKLSQRKIFEMYLRNSENINNWDLVDVTASHIVGDFSLKYKEDILRDLAKSKNLWEKRIAIVSTHAFIKKRNFGETIAISGMLLDDEHDLIHKAVGWMLREVGKRNKNILDVFLLNNYKRMPRTMLRYAIEKFPENERQKWLKGEF